MAGAEQPLVVFVFVFCSFPLLQRRSSLCFQCQGWTANRAGNQVPRPVPGSEPVSAPVCAALHCVEEARTLAAGTGRVESCLASCLHLAVFDT